MVLIAPAWLASTAQDLDQKAQEMVNSRVNSYVAFRDGVGNSAGASLRLQEASRANAKGKLFVSYDLYASGLPRGIFYEFFSFPLANGADAMQRVGKADVTDDGHVRVCTEESPAVCASAALTFEPAKGELVRLALVSTDGKQKAVVSTIPNPITGSDGNCQLAVIRLAPKFEIALIEARGFPPTTELTLHSKSSGEPLDRRENSDPQGSALIVLLPAVKGKKTGTDTVQLSAKDCKPSVSFDWGSTSK